MDTIFTKSKLLFVLLLLTVIVIFENLTHYLNIAAWPAFLCMIFFFLAHEARESIPGILMGGLFGIANLLLIKLFVGALGPSIGPFTAKVVYICIFVACIVLFRDVLPWLFNNYAFFFLLISGIAVTGPNPNPLVWMATELIGGAILIGCVIGIFKIVAAVMKAAAMKAGTKS